jgi:hypothetical protein
VMVFQKPVSSSVQMLVTGVSRLVLRSSVDCNSFCICRTSDRRSWNCIIKKRFGDWKQKSNFGAKYLRPWELLSIRSRFVQSSLLGRRWFKLTMNIASKLWRAAFIASISRFSVKWSNHRQIETIIIEFNSIKKKKNLKSIPCRRLNVRNAVPMVIWWWRIKWRGWGDF